MTEPAPAPPETGTESSAAAPGVAPVPPAEAPDYRDLFLRATAELDNYRKRAERDRQALIQFAAEGLARKLLDPVDSLDRAVLEIERVRAHAPDAIKGALATSQEGLRALKRQFMDALAGEGIEPFRPEGAAFDPSLHEALVRVPHPTLPDGAVVEVLQTGYTMRSRLLRPARVTVSSGPAAPGAPQEPAAPALADPSHGKSAGRKARGNDKNE